MRTVRTKPNIGMERAFVENATLVDSMNREARHFNGDVVHVNKFKPNLQKRNCSKYIME